MNITSLSPPLHWREAAAHDEPFIEAMFAASRSEQLLVSPDDPAAARLLRMQRTAQETGLRQNYPGALRLVIEKGEAPVGQAIVNIGGEELRLLDLVVLHANRRSGIARAVVSTLRREAARRQLPLALTVSRANTPALALYAAEGFVAHAQDMLFLHMRWRAD